ncbi:helix-turn-helix domain-containing protein [Parasalinivibrio latis]|uniref:GlxA family transcriptional regulator n=1 Tax=Parasalinivibrio latis TaxID=2952610 RepID=UPI0030DFCD30
MDKTPVMVSTLSSVSNLPGENTPKAKPEVRFLLLPLPDFAMLPFGGFIDKLRFSADEEDYSQQRYCSWDILGDKPGHICANSGVAVEIQVTPRDIRLTDYDYLVIFGSRTARQSQMLAAKYGELLRQAAGQGVTLVSIDNASFLLASAGLLKGHRVAIHWRHIKEFREAFPGIEVRAEQIYCFDRKRISCAGGGAAIDLAVELLARHCGRTRAMKGLADMLVDEARGEIHQVKSMHVETDVSRHVGRAINLMRGLMEVKTTTEELASLVGISRRQLDRQFKNRFGMTTREYWHEMKMQYARWRLVNSNHSLISLAAEVGIQDTSYFCRVFRQRFGCSPETFRLQSTSPEQPS